MTRRIRFWRDLPDELRIPFDGVWRNLNDALRVVTEQQRSAHPFDEESVYLLRDTVAEIGAVLDDPRWPREDR